MFHGVNPKITLAQFFFLRHGGTTLRVSCGFNSQFAKKWTYFVKLRQKWQSKFNYDFATCLMKNDIKQHDPAVCRL